MISGTGSIVYGRTPDGRMSSRRRMDTCWAMKAVALPPAGALRAVVALTTGGQRRQRFDAFDFGSLVRDHASGPGQPGVPRAGSRRHCGVGGAGRKRLRPSDAVALSILQQAGHELALAVDAVVRRLGLAGPTPCAQAGSMIVKGRIVRQMFLAAAASLGLHLDPVTSVSEPAEGAVRLARESLRRG
jgi:hypothetical protein